MLKKTRARSFGRNLYDSGIQRKHMVMKFQIQKTRWISGVAERLTASEEKICYLEIINNLFLIIGLNQVIMTSKCVTIQLTCTTAVVAIVIVI